MAKLHELLAVEGDLEGAYKKILQETIVTFTKKEAHFLGSRRELKLFDEEAPEVVAEHLEMVTTVDRKLHYQSAHIIRYLNAVLQKETTNQNAKADLIIDGKTIAEGVPATFLLGLETKLKQIRAAYEAIPTLAPGIKWVKDEDKGVGVYRNENVEETFKSEKVVEPVVLYEATKEHPAQVKEAAKTINVGKYAKHMWSGMLTPADKSVLLGRIDRLMRTVKKTRQKANREDVVKTSIGTALMGYIHGDK